MTSTSGRSFVPPGMAVSSSQPGAVRGGRFHRGAGGGAGISARRSGGPVPGNSYTAAHHRVDPLHRGRRAA